MHTQTTIALSLLSIAVIRANRGEQIRDEFSDGDCRTAALCKLINEGE